MSGDQKHDRSRSNIFAELDLPDPEGALTKAELAFQLNSAIEKMGWNDAQTAEHPRISDDGVAALTRGWLSGFSTDTLFHLLTALNIDVTINVEPNLSPDRPARVAVHGYLEPIAASSGTSR